MIFILDTFCDDLILKVVYNLSNRFGANAMLWPYKIETLIMSDGSKHWRLKRNSSSWVERPPGVKLDDPIIKLLWKICVPICVPTQNFPTKEHFLPPNTYTYAHVRKFFGKFRVLTKWMTSYYSLHYSSVILSKVNVKRRLLN